MVSDFCNRKSRDGVFLSSTTFSMRVIHGDSLFCFFLFFFLKKKKAEFKEVVKGKEKKKKKGQ
jgi:hypothetical protein